MLYRDQEKFNHGINSRFTKQFQDTKMTAAKGETKFFTETKGSIFPKGEMTKRNFYLQLFRTYCELPFEETMQSFVKVFNDVFVKEKP